MNKVGRPKKFTEAERLILGEEIHRYYCEMSLSMSKTAKRFGVSEGLAWKLYDEYLTAQRMKK